MLGLVRNGLKRNDAFAPETWVRSASRPWAFLIRVHLLVFAVCSQNGRGLPLLQRPPSRLGVFARYSQTAEDGRGHQRFKELEALPSRSSQTAGKSPCSRRWVWFQLFSEAMMSARWELIAVFDRAFTSEGLQRFIVSVENFKLGVETGTACAKSK